MMSSVEEDSPRRDRMSSQEEEADENGVSGRAGRSLKENDRTTQEPRTSSKRRRESDAEDEDEKEEIAGDDEGDDRGHRDLDRQRQEITDKDAERLAEEFREKYGRSAASRYRGDGAGVAQRLLLPSVDDPSIWAIKCKTGKETDIITKLAKRMMVMESRGQSLGITSAFQRDSLDGYIYVEARKAAFVAAAVKDIPN